MSASPEREWGDRWAETLRASGCWIQKLPASMMSGLPDWLVGRLDGLDPRFVEAKTFGAVQNSKGQSPRAACTTSQQFFLDRWTRSGGRASVLIVDESGFIEIDWKDAHRRLTKSIFDHVKWDYRTE